MPSNLASLLSVPYAQVVQAAPYAKYAKPGPYVTKLDPALEQQFQAWVQQNKIPWQESPTADYDMRGYYKAMQAGDQNARQAANRHFPDTYKTPYHKSFSRESQYALPNAPQWKGNTLVDESGKVIFQENQ